jgi:CubicO group peptidase (beta-lactamase class C family)
MDDASGVKSLDRSALGAIEPALRGVVDAGGLSGAVTLVWKDGEELQFNAVGMRDIEAGAPMTRDTIFRIASMSKPVTSVMALKLMEEGKLKLEDPITRWAPEFAGMRVLKDASGPLDDAHPAPRDITIDDLITHRSGLAYAFSSVGPIAHAYQSALGNLFADDRTPDDWMAALAGLPLLYPPGERFHYGHSTDVLGYIIGRIEGRPFREVLIERLFQPLGMVDTDFWFPPEKRGRAAKVYRQRAAGNGLEEAKFPRHPAPPKLTPGGGGLVSTLDDYLRFARMLFGEGELDGRRYLSAQTVRLMRTNRLTEAQRQIPFLGLPFWVGQGFGLGVSVIVEPENQGLIGPGCKGAFGWPGAFGTWWRADPEAGLILIYLIQNSMELGPEAVLSIAQRQPTPAQLLLPAFQRAAYAAIGLA